jgi:ribosomal protein L37AE/L43A
MKTKEVEFDFDVNIKRIIELKPVTFQKFCNRYPNNMELGAKLREYTQQEKTVCPVCEKESITTNANLKVCLKCQAKIDFADGIIDIFKS